MKMIVTHPNNKKYIERLQLSGGWDNELSWMEVRYDSAIPQFGPCKKIKINDGSIVEREKFVMRCGAITYGPEDLIWLMWAGVVREQFEPVFYIIEKPLNFVADFMKSSMMKTPRSAFLSCFHY